MCIRFNEQDVRPTGRSSMGVNGMSLNEGDEVVGMQLDTQGEHLLFVSAYGMGKRTSLDEFNVQYRGGKGVKCYKITEKTGSVVGVKAVNEENEVMLITTEGIVIRIMVSDISVLGRVTSGVKLINLDDKNVYVASVAKVREDSKTTSDEEVIKNLEKELQEDAVVSDDEEFEEDFDEEDLEEEDFDEDDSDGNDYETDEPDDI
jgi:DNA gyrase subunit A